MIRYANCWEDANILCEVLKPEQGKRFLSIASGGDNSFALLADGADVVAVDLSAAQLACVELKAQAVRGLDYEDVLSFLGVRQVDNRISIYKDLAPGLSELSRTFWNEHSKVLEEGIIHGGKFERFFGVFRTRILPLMHSRKTISALMEVRSQSERAEFYDRRWNNLRWRLLFRIFMSRFVMGRLGRDAEFFRYVEGSVSDRILARTKQALSTLPLHADPYLDYILNGNFTRTLPRYLEPNRFEALRSGLDRLTLHQGTVQEGAKEYSAHGFDGCNLSDIFEYLDPDTCTEVYSQLLAVLKPKGRIAYWNMLAPRSCPAAFKNDVTELSELSQHLHQGDLAFFYSAFVVEEKT